jgi:ribose transport system permease protein
MLTGVGSQLLALLGLVAICIVLSILSPHFLTLGNFFNISRQAAVITIIAIGETFVILTGGIDLSVGSNVTLSSCVLALVMINTGDIALGVLAGLATGLSVGLVNGLLVAKADLPPFIVTLGMLGIAQGAALVITVGRSMFGLPRAFKIVGQGSILGIPVPLIIILLLTLIFHAILTYNRLGRYILSLGGNEEATRLSGIDVDMVKISAYLISGLMAAIGGIVLSSRINSAHPAAGQGFELDAIAAAVIGGTSLMGGEGTIIGTLIGSFMMAVIRNGLNLLNVNTFWQQIVIGVVIIGAVWMDRVRKR